MKKVLLLLLLAGACCSIAHAQLSAGLRAGALSTSYWKLDVPGGGNRLLTRPQFGALAEFAVSGPFSLRAELNYAPKGDAWYFPAGLENQREEISDQFNYLEIPLLAKYSFGTGALKPYAIGGLYFARAFSNKYTEGGKTYDFEDYTKGDFGFQVGGGASMPAGPGRAFAELRLTEGLRDIDAFQDGTSTRFRGLGLSVGWMLDLQ